MANTRARERFFAKIEKYSQATANSPTQEGFRVGEEVAKVRSLAKTCAHELGHYLMNDSDILHVVNFERIMNSPNNEPINFLPASRRELVKSEHDFVRKSPIKPNKPKG